MIARSVLIWALFVVGSAGFTRAEINVSAIYSDASAQALAHCVGGATGLEDLVACAKPYFARCLEVLDDDLFSDCRRTALLWWADRVEEAREIDSVRAKHIALKAERMRCRDTFTLIGDYVCEERKRTLVFVTVLLENL